MLDGWMRLRELGRWVHHERSIGHGFHMDGLLKEAPKKESPEFRAAAVEAKGELVEIRLEVIGFHGPLVGSQQPAFKEAGDAMHPRQGHMGRFARTGYDMGLMQVVVPHGGRVRGQAIGDNDGTRLYAVQQERAQRR